MNGFNNYNSFNGFNNNFSYRHNYSFDNNYGGASFGDVKNNVSGWFKSLWQSWLNTDLRIRIICGIFLLLFLVFLIAFIAVAAKKEGFKPRKMRFKYK